MFFLLLFYVLLRHVCHRHCADRMYNYSYKGFAEVSSLDQHVFKHVRCTRYDNMRCILYICFITLKRYVQKFYHASHYFITGSHHHLHIWNKFLRLTCLTPCFGRCVYVRVLGDDIPMVHAWKQDHCSWTCRSVQTYTHATLWLTVCSALP